ncbi:MAG TPA: hypothetical protein PKK43_12485 [Spirochaetota bacterium]|nr:hypothetical protein [Spirochaetota bacterium]
MKYTLLSIIMVITVISCGDNDNKSDTREYYNSPISEIEIETTGGGERFMTIVHGSDGYVIDVTSINYSTVSYTIPVDASDGEVYNKIDGIFNKSLDLYDESYTPSDAQTGSWTDVTLYYQSGEKVKISNVSAGDSVSCIYEFVDKEVSSM